MGDADRFLRLAEQAAEHGWLTLQREYRLSQADPPETSVGVEEAIQHLRTLAAHSGRPDPRKVVEFGNEHLWRMVYGEEYR